MTMDCPGRAKRTMEINMIGFRPKTSAKDPDSGKIAVLESAYAEPTQVKSSPPLRSFVIVGNAVATAVKSRALRKMDIVMAAKESQKANPLPAFAGAGATSTLDMPGLGSGA